MTMWQYSTLVVLGAVLVLASGCASKSDTAARSSASTTSDVSGTWQGYAGVGARSASVTLNLRQEGPGLSGNLAVGGRPDLSGPVTGRVEGDTLRLRLGSGAVGPEVRVQGDTMTGMVGGEPLSVRRVR